MSQVHVLVSLRRSCAHLGDRAAEHLCYWAESKCETEKKELFSEGKRSELIRKKKVKLISI